MKYLLFALLSCSTWQAFGQQVATVKGRVTDSTSKLPLERVAWLVQDGLTTKTIQTGLTDEQGFFSVANLSPGTYTLAIGAFGYKNRSLPLDVKEAKVYELGDVYLVSSVTQLKAVTIVANKPIIESDAEKLVYNVENDPGAKGSTAIELLRRTPFITVDGNDNIQLNGQGNFKVLLNGKETALFAQNLKEALKGFPGDLIKKVEVITSPSAKYDAEGIGGIINLITDKKIIGTNGNVSTYLSSLGNYQGNAYFSLKAGKLGLTSFLGGSGVFSPIPSQSLSETATLGSAPFRQRNLVGDRAFANYANNGGIELNYDLDTVNTLTGYVNLGKNTRESTAEQTINTHLPSGSITVGSLRVIGDGQTPSLSFGSDYIRKGKRNKEEEFSIRFNGQLSTSSNYTTSFQQDQGKVLDLLNDNREKNVEYTLQTDYLKPVAAQQRLELGAKVIARRAVSDYESLFRTDATAAYAPNPANSNHFNYLQQVYSAYASYNFQLGSYLVKAGIRGEHTQVAGNFISSDMRMRQRYTNLIPNVQVSHKWDSQLSSVLSYTIRLQRPSINNLNPFINNADPLNVSFGNPDLYAQTFHNVNLQTRFMNGNTFAGLTLYGSLSNNMIAQYAQFNPTTGVTTITSDNIGKEQQLSVIMNINTRINKLSMGISSILRYNSVQSRGGSAVVQEGFSGGAFFNGNYKVSDWINISGSGGFQRQSYTLLGRGTIFIPYQVNFGYTLIKDKLTGAVNFNNIHQKTFANKTFVETAAFRQINTNFSPYRVTYFGLTYRFGKLKENVSKKKGVSNDDLLN